MGLISLKEASDLTKLSISQIRYKISTGELEAKDQPRERGRPLKVVEADEILRIVGATSAAGGAAAAEDRAELSIRKLKAEIAKLEQGVEIHRRKIIDDYRDQLFQEMRVLWQGLKNALTKAGLTKAQKTAINKELVALRKKLNA